MIFALDTNILSAVINGNVEIKQKLRDLRNTAEDVIIPLVSYYELKRGLNRSHHTAKKIAVSELCDNLQINGLTMKDIDAAIRIYDDCIEKNIEPQDADILIAAQCIANDYVLITNNAKHFDSIIALNMTVW